MANFFIQRPIFAGIIVDTVRTRSLADAMMMRLAWRSENICRSVTTDLGPPLAY